MSFFEDPDYTGKAPEHVANAIKNLSEFGRTSIEPSSKKYEIIIKKITERTSFTNKYGKTISFDDGYLLSHKSKDLFYEILNDIKALPGRFYLPITKGETYWVIPTSSEKELADFIEKYSLDAPTPIIKPEIDILDTTKDVPFKVGEEVIAHWMYEKYPRSVKAKIIKISDAQIDVVSTEDKTYTEEGVSASYKAGDKRFFYRPFTDTRYLEKITEHDDTGFKVGDLVNAYWEYDSKHLSAQAKIVKISESIGFYKEKGHKSLFETELIEGTSDARYKKGSKVVFGYPFDKDFYLEHTLKTSYPTDFVIGEEVTVHHKVPDREIVIRGIVHELSPEYVTVKYTETVEMYEEGKLENIPIPFNKWNFITKDTGTTLKPLTIESVEVGEHVTAHWIQRGVDKLARVKITSRRIASGRIDFELLEPVTLDMLYETGTAFFFSYPFAVYEFLTRDSSTKPLRPSILSPEESKRHDKLLDKALGRKKSFVDYFPPASSKIYDVPFETFIENFPNILSDMLRKPIPTDEEMGMRAATYE